MNLYKSLFCISLAAISISQSYAQPHSHSGRSHDHSLPVQGISHQHGNGAYGQVSKDPNPYGGQVSKDRLPNKGLTKGWANSCAKNKVFSRTYKDSNFYSNNFNHSLFATEVLIKEVKVTPVFHVDFNHNTNNPFPNFKYTKELKESNFLVPPHMSIETVISQSTYIPSKELVDSGKASFGLIYETFYTKRKNGTSFWGPIKSHTSCVLYTI